MGSDPHALFLSFAVDVVLVDGPAGKGADDGPGGAVIPLAIITAVAVAVDLVKGYEAGLISKFAVNLDEMMIEAFKHTIVTHRA